MSNNLKYSAVYAAAFVLLAALGAFAQTVRTEAVKVGDTAPDFTVPER